MNAHHTDTIDPSLMNLDGGIFDPLRAGRSPRHLPPRHLPRARRPSVQRPRRDSLISTVRARRRRGTAEAEHARSSWVFGLDERAERTSWARAKAHVLAQPGPRGRPGGAGRSGPPRSRPTPWPAPLPPRFFRPSWTRPGRRHPGPHAPPAPPRDRPPRRDPSAGAAADPAAGPDPGRIHRAELGEVGQHGGARRPARRRMQRGETALSVPVSLTFSTSGRKARRNGGP